MFGNSAHALNDHRYLLNRRGSAQGLTDYLADAQQNVLHMLANLITPCDLSRLVSYAFSNGTPRLLDIARGVVHIQSDHTDHFSNFSNFSGRATCALGQLSDFIRDYRAPLPCSPARSASIAAFRASKLV